jgi:hypothetical protein
MALASLPEPARPRPGDADSPRLMVRADAAGATHDFAKHCREWAVAFSFGFAVTQDASSRRQLSLFDMIEGFRHTAFICAPRAAEEKLASELDALELRHRRHARIEDRIRQAKAAGLRNLPCKEAAENHAWLECVLAAADLVAWSKLICFADDPEPARCEMANFRYRILHMAAPSPEAAASPSCASTAPGHGPSNSPSGFARLRAAFA